MQTLLRSPADHHANHNYHCNEHRNNHRDIFEDNISNDHTNDHTNNLEHNDPDYISNHHHLHVGIWMHRDASGAQVADELQRPGCGAQRGAWCMPSCHRHHHV